MSNNDSIEISSSTVEQAISEALQQLGAAEDDVVIEVLATPRSGLLGLGARDARVRVSRRVDVAATSGVTAPPPAPPPQPRAERPRTQPRESKPAQPKSETSETSTAPAQAPPQRQPRGEREQPRQRPPRQEREAPRREAQERQASDDSDILASEAAGDDEGAANRQPANIDEQVKEASAILAQVLELMGEKSEIRRGEGDPESLELEIRGDGSGILIGRHGQTLDALEYLLNRVVARRIKDAMPILLDTESYRARRRQQLHRMALSMGERAKREHSAVKLDPMPPRDRRIVHLALKDDPMITTRSAGEGFLRTIEIVPVDGQRERRGGGGGRENKRERPREREQPRERERDRGRQSGQPPIGEQGGFKHGQKRLF